MKMNENNTNLQMFIGDFNTVIQIANIKQIRKHKINNPINKYNLMEYIEQYITNHCNIPILFSQKHLQKLPYTNP